MADMQTHIVILCECGQKMKVPTGAGGKRYKCVRCGNPVLVPGPAESAPEPAKEKDAPVARNAPPERVGELLVQEGLISQEQLREALGRQQKEGGKTFEILMGLGYLEKNQLHAFLSRQPGMTSIDLARVTIDRKLSEIVPRKLALECLVLPIDRLGNLLTVAMACPLDTLTIQGIELSSGLKVKAMLCRYDDVQGAVEKYYPSESEMNGVPATYELPARFGVGGRTEVGEKLRRLECIGAAGTAAPQLASLAGGAGTDFGKLLSGVEADPGLAALVLCMANSPVYGLPGNVDSLVMALALVGRKGLVRAVTTCSEAGSRGGADLTGLCKRAQRCAAMAVQLAQASGRSAEGVAYTAGLLHEMGRLALMLVAPQKYGELDQSLAREPLLQAEEQIFSMAHPEAGAQLATYWRFPTVLTQAIRSYLSPAEAGDARDLASIVSIASLAAARNGKLAAADLDESKGTLAHLQLTTPKVLQALKPAAGQ